MKNSKDEEPVLKPLRFMGRTLEALRAMPQEVRQDVGYQLDSVQRGLLPNDCKPMKSVAPGCMELRIWCEDGTWRVMYVAKYEDAIYVLHVFKKTTQATENKDVEIARNNFKKIKRE